MRIAFKLFLKILILLFIIVSINQLVSILLPPTWGETRINQKLEAFEQQPNTYNTLFIGSSRFYRQISPKIFDSLVEDDLKLSSFNMGATSYFYPKTEVLYRYLLEETDNLDVIILELDLNNSPAEKNLHTRDQIYWYSFKDTVFLIQSVWQTKDSLTEKVNLISRHILSYAEKLLNAGLGDDILAFYFEPGAGSRFLGSEGDGFYSLDEQVLENEPHILARRDNNTEQSSNNRLRAAQLAFASVTPQGDSNASLAHLERILNLIEYSEEQGVDLFIVLPPRLSRASMEDLLAVFYELPEEHRINLADPALFPDFYAYENSFDPAHLNGAGAELFTRALAEEVLLLLSEGN